MKVFVAMGSNLGDREAHILQAADDITQLPDCTSLVASAIYQSAPMGPQDQPDYLNSACSFECELTPQQLLVELKTIERQHGRTQSTLRWTARPLDLDILLFGDQQIESPELTIPHPGIASRSFVLWPLAELQPDLHLPGLGPVQELMKSCEPLGIRPY